jgi:bifunctional non-homologous end joining protein LigD
MYVESIDAVISAVQNGAVEFHTSGATIPDIAHPDRFTLDLDPGPDVSWTTLVNGGANVRSQVISASVPTGRLWPTADIFR